MKAAAFILCSAVLNCPAQFLGCFGKRAEEFCLNTFDFLGKWMVPHFQWRNFWPPEESFNFQKGILSHSRSHRAEHSPSPQNPAWPSHCTSPICWNFYFSTVFVHFPMPQRAIWNSSCHFWPLILKTQSLHPLSNTLFISPLSFNPFSWWKFSERLQTFQYLAALWWLGENSFRDIFLPWRSSFKGKLDTYFSRSFLKGLSCVLRRLSLSDVWMWGYSSQ